MLGEAGHRRGVALRRFAYAIGRTSNYVRGEILGRDFVADQEQDCFGRFRVDAETLDADLLGHHGEIGGIVCLAEALTSRRTLCLRKRSDTNGSATWRC